MKNKKTTHSLEKILLDVNCRESLSQYLDQVEEANRPLSFVDYFFSLEKVRALSSAQLQQLSDIDRTYFYHIKDGSKKPGRNKVLRLCLAAQLDDDETHKALEAAKLADLYVKDKRDAVVLYALRKHLSVMDTEMLLEEFGLPGLD